jgi:hypothetical protein
VNVYEQFDIGSMFLPAKFKVRSVYTGSFADDVRYDFYTKSNYEILKDYKKYYVFYFEGIQADSLRYSDNADGSFTTTEFYTIADIWKGSKGVAKIEFEPFVIDGIIKRPKEKKRTIPVDLRYPVNYHEEIKVNLDEAWNIEEAGAVAETPNFHFASRVSALDNSTTLLTYDYENLKDCILPEEMDAYLEGLKKMDAASAYDITSDNNQTISRPTRQSSGTTADKNFGLLYALLFISACITYLVRRKNKRVY